MLFDLCRQWFGEVHGWLFQSVVLPIVQWSGLSVYTEDAFDGTEEFLFGALQVLLLAAVLMPLERRFPRERWQGFAAVRTDVIYTFLHRLGLFPLFFFFAFRPMFDRWESWLHFNGWPTTNLETWWHALAANPLLAFAAYLVIIDFAKYWIHRAQHRFEWWWALHSLHHSQRQMTFWTDDRNHLLDSVLTDGTLALLALGIGVAPGQFLALVVVTRMVESLSHANLRINFGAVGERLLVSPRFHRLHHAISASRSEAYQGVNFAILFPVWDLVFRTANFRAEPGPTGVEDQLAGRDYGIGFWAQQWLGIKRLARVDGSVAPNAGRI
jgi:sterol desaturase/sphingolipid hydroxylase (fatty acid hydroxylase superfamily)